MIKATVVADSINWLGKRITTLILEYPRYIHSEFMTHRVLSKNSASSRAIPIEKVIEDIEQKSFYPHFTAKKKGMQGSPATDEQIDLAQEIWNIAKFDAIRHVQTLNSIGIHKQNVNRLLEPFFTMKVLCTGTEWENFFALRAHPDAQPEIQELAKYIKKVMEESVPVVLQEGEWHIPFGDNIDVNLLHDYGIEYLDNRYDIDALKIAIATARCARISYNPPELDKPDYKRDIELYDRLLTANPAHLSPFEHVAKVPTRKELTDGIFNSEWVLGQKGWYEHNGYAVSNLKGWIQLRKIVEYANK